MEDWEKDDVIPFPRSPFRLVAGRLPDPKSIPPREWLYGTRLIRRFVTLLVAPGGTGKTQFAIGVAMSLASGRPLLGDTVHHRVNSAVLNLEDPLDELERRVAAMMIHHKVTREELEGRLFLYSGRDRRVTIAQVAEGGYEIQYPDEDAIVAAMLEAGIGHLVVDPFVKSHALEENSNSHMDAAVEAWARVAQRTGAAIDLIHHTRKGAATDIEASRGGKALSDGARSGQLMATMTEEEALELGIPVSDRLQYAQLYEAKANMAPRATRGRWYQLVMVNLGNGTPEYPQGDNVAAIAPWRPRDPWKVIPPIQLNALLDRINEGPEEGSRYTDSSRRGGKGEADRWVGNLLMAEMDLTDEQAKRLIDTWLREGVFEVERYYDQNSRKERKGLRVVDDKRPSDDD